MAISLDVVTRLNDRSARTAAQEAQRYFDQAGRQTSANWDREMTGGFQRSTKSAQQAAAAMQRAFDQTARSASASVIAERKMVEVRKLAETQAERIARAERNLATLRSVEHPRAIALTAAAERELNTLRQQGERITTQLISAGERLNNSRRSESSSAREAARAHMDFLRATEDAAKGAGTFVGSLTQLGTSLNTLGRIATPAAIVGLGGAIVQLGSIAASASQSLLLIPGAVGAIGTAFGTVKLATAGLDDAFKNINDPEKLAESLRSLAPSAQQFVLSIQSMMPALTGLQQATQGAFFNGIGQQLNQLANQYLPTIQAATTSVASSFNQMFSGVTTQLMTPQTQTSVQTFLNNVSSAFQALAPATAPLTRALADLMAVGSGALPDLARAATEAANSFAAFISHARATGDLDRWLGEGLDTLRDLGSIAMEVGKAFMAMAPYGRDILPVIRDLLKDIQTTMPLIAVAANTVGAPIGLWSIGLKAAAGALDVVKAGANAIIPVINRVTETINMMLAPVRAAIDVANSFGAGIPQIPELGKINQIGSGAPTQGGLPGAQAERRGGTSSFSQPGLPTAGLPGVPGGGYSAPGSNWWDFGTASAPLNLPRTTSPSAYVDQLIANGQAQRSAASGGGHVEDTGGALVPNAEALKRTLQQLFPGVEIGGWRPKDGFNEHSSGEALDIMVGSNRLLGDQINRWLLQNASAFGLDYNLWRQAQWDPSGTVKPMAGRGSPTQNHMDHVHARVAPGDAANGLYMPVGATAYQPGGVQDVAVQSFGSSAQTDLNGAMSQMGNQLDADLGFSKGLPGLAENAVKFVGNLFFAPLLTALSALAGAAPNEGSGLLGMAAANGALPGFGGGTGLGGPSIGASAGASPFGISPSAMGPAALQPPGGWSADWNAMAQKESSGNWGIDTGNGYQGGLQFSPSSWAAAGGTQYAPSANLATPFQQAMTAEQLLKMQGPGAWPNTFTPGSSGPGGGGSMLPGLGMPQAAPMGATGGMAYPATAGSGGAGVGGMAMDAAMMGAGALNALAPGAGAAAQIGIQLANRTIKYASQVAGIATSGLLETFSVGDNPLGSLGAGWFGKLAGGVASARPATPNKAGQSAPPRGADDPKAAAQAGLTGGKAARNGNTANITINNNGASPDQNGKDIAAHTAAMWAPAGRQ